MKKLSRTHLKNLHGGEESPSGNYKCYWDKYPDICSKSVHHKHETGTGPLTCVEGAHLEPA